MKRIPFSTKIIFHAFGIATLFALSLLATVGLSHARLLIESTTQPGFDFQWEKAAIQVGLAACVWAMGIIVYQYVQIATVKKKTTSMRLATGSVMVEFLIVLVPYLLLTSGLAQLSQLNVTGMLADVAVYDAARTVWLWAPEASMERNGRSSDAQLNPDMPSIETQIRWRARTVAASILAPTGPGNYHIGQVTPSPYPMTDHRSVMTGMFRRSNNSQDNWEFTTGSKAYNGGTFSINGSGGVIDPSNSSENSGANTPGRQTEGRDVTFSWGFDTIGFAHRAGRKITVAEFGMWQAQGPGSFEAIMTPNESGAQFTYYYNIVFPWFGYMWGEDLTIAGRKGYYTRVNRRHTFAAQPDMR